MWDRIRNYILSMRIGIFYSDVYYHKNRQLVVEPIDWIRKSVNSISEITLKFINCVRFAITLL